MVAGDLQLEVAYMQGRLKVDGGYERLVFGLRSVAESTRLAGVLVGSGRPHRGLTVGSVLADRSDA